MLERIVGLVVVAAAGVYLTQAMALPFGTAARPGAGFFPVFVAVFACAAGMIMTVRAFLAAAPAGTARETERDAAARNRALSTMVVLVVFCALLPWIGYPIIAFAFVAVLLQRLGSTWRAAIIIGVLTAAVSYYVFGILLDVPLPSGPW
ncbi:MAG TPA: tripartite tricarboxylate transporter TctB family protein [Methylomirabilota bacterium]|jgi:putative tricarboxylic transport membrane protein